MSLADLKGCTRLRTRLDNPHLTATFLATVADRAEIIAVRDNEGRLERSYAELAEWVSRIAAGLTSLGLRKGECVALMLRNRPEFFAMDIAVMFAGGIPFSLYNTAPASQLLPVLADAGARIILCEREFLPVLSEARALGAPIVSVVAIDGDGSDGTITLAQLETAGRRDFDLAAAAADIDPDDIATIIYTSGSTGMPKGVELTHANMMAEVRAINQAVPHIEEGSYISVLPAAHIGDRARSLYGALISFGHTVTTVADPADLVATARAVRPLYFGNPPRTFEKIRASIEARYGSDVAKRGERDPGVGEEVRDHLGLDRALWISTGSAPTQADQFAFFDALGIRLCELWGMSETCSMATTNTPVHCKFGTVGRAMDGVELKLAEDGELLVRGPTIARRYRNRPKETAEAFDTDGWFRTGDVADMDSDGYWRITGRKKEIIISAAGKNMYPTAIEDKLKSSSQIIMQACTIGDGRPFNVALIVVDTSYRDRDEEFLQGAVEAAVAKANQMLSRVEQIKRFAILRDEWLAGGDELTPTMKLKRREIEVKYETLINELYARRENNHG